MFGRLCNTGIHVQKLTHLPHVHVAGLVSTRPGIYLAHFSKKMVRAMLTWHTALTYHSTYAYVALIDLREGGRESVCGPLPLLILA